MLGLHAVILACVKKSIKYVSFYFAGQSEPAPDRGGDVQPHGDFQAVQDHSRSAANKVLEWKVELRNDLNS